MRGYFGFEGLSVVITRSVAKLTILFAASWMPAKTSNRFTTSVQLRNVTYLPRHHTLLLYPADPGPTFPIAHLGTMTEELGNKWFEVVPRKLVPEQAMSAGNGHRVGHHVVRARLTPPIRAFIHAFIAHLYPSSTAQPMTHTGTPLHPTLKFYKELPSF